MQLDSGQKHNICYIGENMNKKYDLLIFDMDGTILDTLDDLKNSCNHALTLNGRPERTREEVRAFVGNGLGRLVELALNANKTEVSEEFKAKVLSDLKAHYAIHCNDLTKPYDGICDVLNSLKEKGYKLAVVSNKIDSAVGELCKIYFPGIFDFFIGEKEGLNRKPAPDMVVEAMKHFGVEKEKAIYIGDSEVDFMTAKNSGLECIAVTWGFRDRCVAIEHGMELIADAPEQILSMFE